MSGARDLHAMTREERLAVLLAEPDLTEERARFYNRIFWSVPDDGPMLTSVCHVPMCRMHEHTEEDRRRYEEHVERVVPRAKGGGGHKKSSDEKKEDKPLFLTWRMNSACAAPGPCACCGYFYSSEHKEKAGQKVVWR